MQGFRLSDSNEGQPLVQSLGAFKRDCQLNQSRKGSRSTGVFREAHLEQLFPKTITDGFLEFIKRLDAIWAGIADGSTLLYAPVIEWDTYHLRVDRNMRTPIPNVYAVGDGAGISQGVVSAATSGMIAAKHLSQTYLNPNSVKQFVGAVL